MQTSNNKLNRELSDTIMNVVGSFMWVAVGATALHYWYGYMADHDYVAVAQERVVITQTFYFCLYIFFFFTFRNMQRKVFKVESIES